MQRLTYVAGAAGAWPWDDLRACLDVIREKPMRQLLRSLLDVDTLTLGARQTFVVRPDVAFT